MPSAVISDQTVLLTGIGWARASALPGDCTVFGIDRHGRPAPQSVSLTCNGDKERPVYFGTDSSFGVFASSTPLLTHSGRSLKASDLAELPTIREMWFESIVDLPDGAAHRDSAEHIWHGLMEAASFVGVQRLALRCRNGASVCAQPGRRSSQRFWSRKRVESQDFLIIQKTDLRAAIAKGWASAVIALAVEWLHDPENLIEEMERDHSPFGLWYISALRALGIGYKLKYDSLQHTLSCCVEHPKDLPRGLGRGGCVCYGHQRAAVMRIGWGASGWVPIVSGFLVTPE